MLQEHKENGAPQDRGLPPSASPLFFGERRDKGYRLCSSPSGEMAGLPRDGIAAAGRV